MASAAGNSALPAIPPHIAAKYVCVRGMFMSFSLTEPIELGLDHGCVDCSAVIVLPNWLLNHWYTQILGYLFHWGLFGVLCVQVCE